MNLNNDILSLKNARDTSLVIRHFDFEYVLDIIEDNYKRRILGYNPSLPNVVGIIEQQIKATYLTDGITAYPQEATALRDDMYVKIINALCKSHGLVFNNTDSCDYYSLAFYLYDFLISNFRNIIIEFYTSFILKEKTSLYNTINNDMKKNKDSSTTYGKKLYKDQKLAVINANLEDIMNMICGMDIPFEDILKTVYHTNATNISKYISEHIKAVEDFYQTVYVKEINTYYIKQSILTDIRLALHAIGCGDTTPKLDGADMNV